MQTAVELARWLYHLFLLLPWLMTVVLLVAWAVYLAWGGMDTDAGDDL